MSKRYICLLVLISILKRLRSDYQIVGSSVPQDRDTMVALFTEPVPTYLLVTNRGITYEHCSLNNDTVNYRVELLVSSAMAAVEAIEYEGGIDD